MKKRLQNRIAESRSALPFFSFYGIAVWLLFAWLIGPLGILPNFIIFVLATYFMVELNNRNTLLRTYSRMVSCSYIILMMMFPNMILDIKMQAVQLCFIIFYAVLFKTYQNRYSQAHIFFAYFVLGCASLVSPSVLILIPIIWILNITCLMSFTGKSFFASLLGLLAPYWIIMPYIIYKGGIEELYEGALSLYDSIVTFKGFDVIDVVSSISAIVKHPLSLCFTFVLLYLVISIAHYIKESYYDKIQVRMLYTIFIVMTLVILMFIIAGALIPSYFGNTAHVFKYLLIVNASPLIAHFITFTNSKTSNILSMLFFVMSIFFAIINMLIFMAL